MLITSAILFIVSACGWFVAGEYAAGMTALACSLLVNILNKLGEEK